MGKHTPGPWTIGQECVNSVSIRAGGIEFATLMRDDIDEVTEGDETWANARLIAAAPVMYALLRKWLAWIDRADDRECIVAVEQQARALLAKLEGSR